MTYPSVAEVAANRRNALLSTGPRTAAGRKASSMNALRHGLTGQFNVMPHEDREVYDQFCRAFTESLGPATPAESQFAQSAAEDVWRLNRARAIENGIFAIATANIEGGLIKDDSAECPSPDPIAHARVFVADSHNFQLLTIYEQRIHRSLQKSMQQLATLQASRRALEAEQKAQRDQAFDEARQLLELAEIDDEPYDNAADYPDPQGFVFANAEISQFSQRQRRLQEARNRLAPLKPTAFPQKSTSPRRDLAA